MSRRPQCYIAGPMRGIPFCNFPAFAEASDALEASGWNVFSPHLNDIEKGLIPDANGDPGAQLPLKAYMVTDLAQVCQSDAIFMLPGWENSKGANLEHNVAQSLDIPVYDYTSGGRITILHSDEHGQWLGIDHSDVEQQAYTVDDLREISELRALADEFGIDLDKSEVDGRVRQFATGATRNADAARIDPEGFLSPLALISFCDYMNANRVQADGSVRDSDNWQKGIPLDAYMKSMWRHLLEVWLIHRKHSEGDIRVSLNGLLFNVCGYLHEHIKGGEAA